MKPQFRFYTHDRAATFKFEGKPIVLRKADQFQLVALQGKSWVVKDGFRYPVNPKLVAELKRRSEPADVHTDYAAAVKEFDKMGHVWLKYVELQARKLSKDVDSGFKNNQVWARFIDGTSHFVLAITPTDLSYRVYMVEKRAVRVAEVGLAISRIAKRMREKFGIRVEKFKPLTSHVSNVTAPWRERFSGTIYSYSAKYFKD
jgi:hypothetical protein